MSEKVIIIGGGAAGPKTAAKLRRLRSDMDIDIYTQEDIISYSACGLPYFIENIIQSSETLILRTPEDFKKQNVNVHIKHKCLKVNTEERNVLIENLETKEKFEVYYDILVIATGAIPVIPNIEGVNLKNIYTLRTINDGINIKQKMKQSKKAVLIGGGYISIEIMEALIANDIDVTLIEKNSHILKMFDEDLAQIVQDYIIGRNPGQAHILTNENVIKFEGNENNEVTKVITASGKEIETDFVVLGAGVRPNTDFLKDSNIKLGIKGSIKVDTTMKTNKQGIYAVGDCTHDFNLVTNRHVWIPLGATANKEGRCAAINIAGGNCIFEGILNSTITKYFDLTISIIGISQKEAQNLGFQTEFAIVTKRDKAGYMPDPGTMTLKLLADKNTHTILGLQGIGEGDVNQRINTVIPAILGKTKIESFMNLDLPYAPPYSPAIDPVLNAAQIVYQKMED